MTNITSRGRIALRGRTMLAAPLAFAMAAVVTTPAPVYAADSTEVVVSGEDAPALRRVSDHVVVISIDGLRPDAIDKFRAGTLQKLMREGAYTLNAQTIMPSKTLPSHTSMVTGVDVSKHGIDWNSDQTDDHGVVGVPTMFGEAREAGLHTAAFFSKTKFHHLEVPNTLDHARSPKNGIAGLIGRWSAGKTVSEVERYLESDAAAPNLMFVHIGEPDYAGHLFGWMSPWYGEAVREADAAVAEVIDEAGEKFGEGNFTVIVTADHGGHDKTHGSDNPLDTTIPWITWGKGVQQGATLPTVVRTMDTAATALWLLGLPQPESWEGNAVALAFGGEAELATR